MSRKPPPVGGGTEFLHGFLDQQRNVTLGKLEGLNDEAAGYPPADS